MLKMIELRNEAQREEYIKQNISSLWYNLFEENPKQFNVDFVNVGAWNFVYRVESNGKVIYLKQALQEPKNKEKLGKEFWTVPKERIKYEERYIQIINKFLPQGVELPEILNYDEKNNILILSDISRNGISLETFMLDGNFNERTAYYLGKFLGISNKKTFGKKIIIRGKEEEDLKCWHLFLMMRTKGILQRGEFPEEVKKELESFHNEVKNKYTFNVLINADYCPKNVIERKNGSVGLIDFEQACGLGDIAYDLGFLMGHYLIISVIRKEKFRDAINAMKQILNGYNEEMINLKDKQHDERVIKYAGAVMVYRITGSSPAPYIKAKDIPLIKEIGFYLIINKFEDFDRVFDYLEKTLTKS